MEKRKDRKPNLLSKRYLRLVIQFITIFISFQVMGNIAFYINELKTPAKNDILTIPANDKYSAAGIVHNNQDVKFVIITGKTENSDTIIRRALENGNKKYMVYATLYEIPKELQKSLEVIMIASREIGDYGDKSIIEQYLNQGVHVIFAVMPNSKSIENNDLYALLGLKEKIEEHQQKGIRFISDFMLGGMMEYPEIEIDITSVNLTATCKTYAYGMNSKDGEELRNEELPPIIWRNSYLPGQVFVINAPFMDTVVGYGILSAVFAQIYSDYVYPIINGLSFIVNNFPYSMKYNTEEIMNRYSRDSLNLQQDILFPAITSISRKYDLKPNCFINISENFMSNKNTSKSMAYYKREIMSLGGDIGTRNEDYSSIENILIVPLEEKYDFEIVDGNISVPIIVDGLEFTDEDKLRYYSTVSALGIITQSLDIDQVIHQKSEDYNWVNASKKLEKLIFNYRTNFKHIESLSITNIADRIHLFNTMKPEIIYRENSVEIIINNFYGEAYFILRTDKDIDNISSGNIIKMESNAYLVKANREITIIDLKENKLDKYY